MRCNNILDEGHAAILEAYKENKSLQSIGLSSKHKYTRSKTVSLCFQIFVDDNDEPVGEKVIKQIVEIACSRPWMKKIDLIGDNI